MDPDLSAVIQIMVGGLVGGVVAWATIECVAAFIYNRRIK